MGEASSFLIEHDPEMLSPSTQDVGSSGSLPRRDVSKKSGDVRMKRMGGEEERQVQILKYFAPPPPCKKVRVDCKVVTSSLRRMRMKRMEEVQFSLGMENSHLRSIYLWSGRGKNSPFRKSAFLQKGGGFSSPYE